MGQDTRGWSQLTKGLVNVNGEPKDAAESGCSKLNDVGVMVRVNQPFPKMEESRLVLLPLPDWVARLREELSGCNIKYLPTGGDVEW